jgi:cellulose synthase/poly-beta-1,6-N-acetylglucosamine synthase-like glycosyltransferase
MFHKPKNWRENILSIEFASLVGSGAALIQSNYPTMCNGANLAYEKEIFLEVNGYKDNYEIASGDDEFLMHKIAQKYPKGISFLKHKNSTVTTKAPKNWEEFFNQRKRWASKWGGYRFIYVKIIALLLFISNLSVLVSFYLSITDIRQSLLFLPILIFKISLECLFLRSVLVYFGQNLKILPFLGTTALYPFYVLSFGFIGRFGKYNWKGRYVK